MKLAATCQQHGGPVTADNLELLENLSEKELITDVSCLKATFASKIKLRKRVKEHNSEKYKMINLQVEQLKQSIKSVLKPSYFDGKN